VFTYKHLPLRMTTAALWHTSHSQFRYCHTFHTVR